MKQLWIGGVALALFGWAVSLAVGQSPARPSFQVSLGQPEALEDITRVSFRMQDPEPFQSDNVLDGLECPFQYGPGVDLDDLDVGQGELGARFQCAGGDDDRCFLLCGAEHTGHQGKGDQGQGADDDDRRSCFLHDVPPVCGAAHAGCPNVTDTSYQKGDRVSFLGYSFPSHCLDTQ